MSDRTREELMEELAIDQAKIDAYLTFGCGPGNHSFNCDPNDYAAEGKCLECGQKKYLNFSEKAFRAVMADSARTGKPVQVWGAYNGELINHLGERAEVRQ